MIATETETREIQAKNVGPGGAVVAQLQGVSKNYSEVKALRDVDLAIHAAGP